MKFSTKRFFYFPSVILLLTAFSAPEVEYPVTQSGRDEILSLLIADPEIRAFAEIEIPSQSNVTICDDFISLHLFAGQDLLFGGVRSEVTVNFPFEEHETVVYEWEVMIPRDFVHDAPENRWWNMVQWHDQPDLTLGETWADLPSASPPVSLHLKFYEDQFYFAPRYMHAEPPQEDLIAVEPGEWIKLKFEIRWSQADDGYLKIWVNDLQSPHIHYTGPNMHNGYHHYLKLGMYRHPEIDTDNTINLRSLHIYESDIRIQSIGDHRLR